MAEEKVSVSIEIEDKFTQALNKMNESLNKFNDNLEKTKTQGDKTNSTMEKFAAGAAQAASAFAAFSFLSGTINEFRLADQAITKLNKAFENSKGSIGVTRKELKDLGKTLEDKTLFGGESIAAMQQKFISFGNIGGQVFVKANKLALDFATATGKDAAGAAAMLGKALSNPVEGLGALSREGIKFNAEQERMIEKFVKTGDIVSAQNIILNSLEQTYSGMSEAATQGTGSIDKLKQQFGQLAETIGEKVFAVIEPFINYLSSTVIPFLNEWSDTILIIVTGIVGGAGLVVAIQKVMMAFQMLTSVNPWLLALQGSIIAVIYAVKNWDSIMEFLIESWHKLKVFMLNALSVISDFVPDALMPFKKELKSMLEDAKKQVDDMEKEKKAKAEARRQQELEAEKLAAKKEADEKVKAAEAYNKTIKTINLKNIQEEARKKAESMKGKDEELESWELKKKQEKMNKEKALMERKKKLLEKYSSDQADYIISEEDRVANNKKEMEMKKFAIENDIGNARMDATKDFFGQMSQLQQIKTREMFEIGKAASIATAVMNTYEGITKTLATYPFPMSGMMAAAQAALGFAQVQNISSQSFENGGVVGGFMGTTPGRDTTLVNARPGEMYLNARQQKNLFDKIDTAQSSDSSRPTVVNYNTNVKMYGNGDKQLKKMIEKTIETKEKRKLQKQQFVKGRFAT